MAFFFFFLSCSTIDIYPDEPGTEERGIVCCLSISTTHYHIMSLVSRSDRSGLRSLVQAAVRFKVSLCAQKFFAHNRALLITLCLLRLRFPYSSSSSTTTTTLRPPLCLCTTLHCLALCTAEVSHFFIASFVWLGLPKRRRHVSFSFFQSVGLLFHSLSLPLYHSFLATDKYLPPLNIIASMSLSHAETTPGFSAQTPYLLSYISFIYDA